MRNHKMIITSSCIDIKKIDSLTKNLEVKKWLYLGSDFITLSSLEHNLSVRYKLIDIIDLHKKVADYIRGDYIAWVDKLNGKYGSDIEWWVGTIFSRNNYSSNLFQYVCYLEILDRLISEQDIIPDVLFVESSAFAEAVRSWAVKKSISVKIITGSFIIINVIGSVKPVLDWLRFIITATLCQLAALISKIRCRIKNPLSDNAIIISTFIHDNSLSENGIFVDRYFPFLCDYASNNSLRISIHPMLYGFNWSYLSVYSRMRKSKLTFIIKEDFLCLSDYIVAATYPIRSLIKKIVINNFRSFNLSSMIKKMRFQENFSSSMNAILIFRLFNRLKKIGFKPSLLTLWYENQAIDKALIAGMRRYFPEVRIIGAQVFLHPPNFLNLYPIQSEVDADMSPDILIETSGYQCDRARMFANSMHCKIGAALRYAYIFNQNNQIRLDKERKPYIVLVALPFCIPTSIEILFMLRDSLADIKHKITIFIKTHPDYDINKIKRLFGESCWPEAFQIFDENMAEGIKIASILISANSSALVEAVSCGIPSIYIGSRIMTNQNILKDIVTEISCECYAPKELAQKINSYIEVLPSKVEEFKKIGVKIRDLYFTPVSDDTIAPFFDIEELV